jgi:hypothetical protein
LDAAVEVLGGYLAVKWPVFGALERMADGAGDHVRLDVEVEWQV